MKLKDLAWGAAAGVLMVGSCSLLQDKSYCTRDANYDLIKVDGDGKSIKLGDNWVTSNDGKQCYFVQSQSAPPETLPFKQTGPGRNP